MDTKDVILELRTKKGMSQDELAYTLTATDRLSGYPDKRSNPED